MMGLGCGRVMVYWVFVVWVVLVWGWRGGWVEGGGGGGGGGGGSRTGCELKGI